MRPSRRAASYCAAFILWQLIAPRAPGCLALENLGASFDEDDGFDASEFALFEDNDEDEDEVRISTYDEDEDLETNSGPQGVRLRHIDGDARGAFDVSASEGGRGYEPTPELLLKSTADEREESEAKKEQEGRDDEEDFDVEVEDEALWFTEDPEEAAAQATAAHAAATASKLKAVTCAATAEADEASLEVARRMASGAAAETAHAMEHWTEVKRKEDAVEQELLTYAEFEDSFNEEIAWAAAEFGEEAVAHREVVAEIRGRAQNATLAAARHVALANARMEDASAMLAIASERATASVAAAKKAAKEALAHESVANARAKAQAIASVLARKRQAEEWEAATKAAASRAASLKAEAAKVELARAESAQAHASSIAAAAAAHAAATSAEANRAAYEAQAAEERASVEITAAEDAAAAAESEAKARAAATKRKRAQAQAVAAKAAAEAAAQARHERDLAAERANREAHKAAAAHSEAKSHADTAAAAEAASWGAEPAAVATGVPRGVSESEDDASTDQRDDAAQMSPGGMEGGSDASMNEKENENEEVFYRADGVSDGSVSALVAAYSRSMGEQGAFEDEVERVLAEINSKKSAFESEVDRVLARYGGAKVSAETTARSGNTGTANSVDYTRAAKATTSSASSTSSADFGASDVVGDSMDSTSITSNTDNLAARGSNGYYRSDDYISSSSDYSSKQTTENTYDAENGAPQPGVFSKLSSVRTRSPLRQQQQQQQQLNDSEATTKENNSHAMSRFINSSSSKRSDSGLPVMPGKDPASASSATADASTISGEANMVLPSSSSSNSNPWSNVFDFTWVDLGTADLLPISSLAATPTADVLTSSMPSSSLSPPKSLSSSPSSLSLSSSSMMSSLSLPAPSFTEIASLSAPAVDRPASTTVSPLPLSSAEPGITLRVLERSFTVAKLDPGSRRQRKAAATLFADALDDQADHGLQGGYPAINSPGSNSDGGDLKSGSDSPVFVAATSSEISVVAPTQALLRFHDELFTQERHPPVLDDNWRCLEVAGPMAFTEVGIMARLSGCLAKASISLLAQSTFDTDYLCVKTEKLTKATQELRDDGHRVE